MPSVKRRSTRTAAVKEVTAGVISPNPYLEKIRLKRKLNEKKLDDLGLTQMKHKRQRKVTPTKPKNPKDVSIYGGANSSVTPSPPPRRSNRVSKKPVEFKPEEQDFEEALLAQKIVRRRQQQQSSKKFKVKRRTFDLGVQISADQRKKLKLEELSSDDWVDDLEEYFRTVEGNSVSNVQRVMAVVNKLVDGRGVRHPHTGEVFLKGTKETKRTKDGSYIHMGMDFRSMLDDASEWVYNNGGDRGNGWLIEHPVKKLWIYQQARAANNKGEAFFPDV
uniref:Uncharacterized protein n=1 Tax=Chaetoceros debilis TaxID=122233 RepID=A0A7S3V9T0_9STRA|mmetsp:Transcript_9896/g.14902  ORF Transcript_9896/g.14902 Transcript_9896/m.14902 type:complete len:276 (+) Transcript_9896:163-990(+)|eukprot:CAMPEP_0194072740 /NCGR_PEP_ID=MMETSP0149-20130528/394_1 /TAXON_ID=122233 /ORGANISM="Chaetoceros debilis, Strain MM31A-1" /LENGTH=275 /DNA_ID=CAMNT_0038752645 /DNA_START=62 /DNA_END=889 /DNA_ORIENTATION=+